MMQNTDAFVERMTSATPGWRAAYKLATGKIVYSAVAFWSTCTVFFDDGDPKQQLRAVGLGSTGKLVYLDETGDSQKFFLGLVSPGEDMPGDWASADDGWPPKTSTDVGFNIHFGSVEFPTSTRDACDSFAWILECFLAMIRNSYVKGSPRSVEADKLVTHLLSQVRPQVSDSDFEFVSQVQKYLECNYRNQDGELS